MSRMVKDTPFWMGILGAVVGSILMQGLTVQPWARGQPAPTQNAEKSVTVPPGGITHAGMGGSESVSRLVPFQAYLTDTAGRPVDGPHDLVFRLYDRSTGGRSLWAETHAAVRRTYVKGSPEFVSTLDSVHAGRGYLVPVQVDTQAGLWSVRETAQGCTATAEDALEAMIPLIIHLSATSPPNWPMFATRRLAAWLLKGC